MPKIEYAIWGCSKGETEEKLLATSHSVKTEKQAITAKKILEEKYGCHSVRIQEIDMTDNDIAIL